ncbi:MAG: hypothetical protein V4621_02265 [Pseudomonadota bacterium]
MRSSGYWIECVPCHIATGNTRSEDVYAASIDVFPDMMATAPSPDMAVDRMRQKLQALRRDYDRTGQLLPKPHSPNHPPTRHRTTQGWLSVYIEIEA